MDIKNLRRGGSAVFVPDPAKPGSAKGLRLDKLPFIQPGIFAFIFAGGNINGEVMEQLREIVQIQIEMPVVVAALSVCLLCLNREIC